MNASYPLLFSVLTLCTLAPRSIAAESIDDVDKMARDWVKMRVETNQLDTGWSSQSELLKSTLAALKERASSLTEKRDFAKAKTAEERKEIDALVAKNRAADEDLKVCEVRLGALTKKLIALRPNLPPRLSEALEMSYRSLASADLPFGERMQLAMNVLNRCAQFNRSISTGEDVLTLEGEPTAKSLDVIYWGLSYGYAVDRTGHRAWLGRPGPDGWQWKAQPGAFDRVEHLVAIARDRSDPAFVVIPAQVARVLPATAPSPAP